MKLTEKSWQGLAHLNHAFMGEMVSCNARVVLKSSVAVCCGSIPHSSTKTDTHRNESVWDDTVSPLISVTGLMRNVGVGQIPMDNK